MDISHSRRVGGTTARPLTPTLAVVILAGLASAARAQWTTVNLHPAGATSSEAHGIFMNEQVGWANIGGVKGGLWTGSAASWTSLNPVVATQSTTLGVVPGQQAGQVLSQSVRRASTWSGTAASWVSLHPAGAAESIAWATHGGQQVGRTLLSGIDRASLWTGSGASWVDLSTPASTFSSAYGVHSGTQVGELDFGAALWSGSAASYVNLHPAGLESSAARAVHAGQQVGWTLATGDHPRAALWSGSAASWVDLDPAGSTESQALAVFNGQQVGFAIVGGVSGAALWKGSAASWVDLHSFLSGFSSSSAHGIWSDSGATYIVGWAHSITNNRHEAILWIGPPPVCYANCDGSTTVPVLTANDFVCFLGMYANNDPYANCDGSSNIPLLTANDFLCFLNEYAAGCS